MKKTKLIAHFDLTGTAHISVKKGIAGPVYFKFAAVDGFVPTTGEVIGDGELLDVARHAGRATLCMLDTIFCVNVLGKNNKNGALIVDGAPMFRALVSRVAKAA